MDLHLPCSLCGQLTPLEDLNVGVVDHKDFCDTCIRAAK